MATDKQIDGLIRHLRSSTADEAKLTLHRLKSKDSNTMKALVNLLDGPNARLQHLVMNFLIRTGRPAILPFSTQRKTIALQ